MLKFLSTSNQPNFRRRAPALLGVLMLALFQVAAASHQFEHVADHGFSDCEVCTSTQQLDDALVPASLAVSFPLELHLAIDVQVVPVAAAPAFAPYHSRAPPLS